MKILIIQLAKMGDLLQSNFLLDDLKTRYPQAEITLLIDEKFLEVTKFLANDKYIGLDLGKIAERTGNSFRLKKSTNNILKDVNVIKYDLGINLNSTQLAEEIFRNITAEKKIGFGSNDDKSLEWLYFNMAFIKSRRYLNINLVDIWRGLSGFPIKKISSERTLTGLDNIKSVVFQLGSRSMKRQFPIQYFARIAKILLVDNCEIILTGIKDEEPIAEDLQRLMDYPHKVKNLVGKTSLSELFELVSKSDLVVTTDTGTMHVAGYYQIPTIAIFLGPADPTETLSYNPNNFVFIPDKTVFHCYPCYENEKCPYNLKCHDGFDIKRVEDLLNGKKSIYYKPKYDQLGQYIEPVNLESAELGEDYLSFVNRSFAIEYFTNERPDLKKYLSRMTFKAGDLEILRNEISREIRIYNHLIINNIALYNNLKNFKYLVPIVYLNKLIPNENLVDNYLAFLERNVI